MIISSPKRILHVVGAMNRAGTETMLMNIYRNIDRSKVQFDFISYSTEKAHYDEEIERLGGKVIKLSPPSKLGMNKSINEMIEAININGPYDAVHSHTLFNSGIAMLAAKKCNIKIRISHAHTTLDNSESIIRKIYINLMRTLINRNSTDLLACSKEAGKYLFGEKKLSSSKYTYLPNLINYEDILEMPKQEVEEFKNKEGLNQGIVIGHIGTFKDSKNHKFLLEMTKYMKESNIDVNLLLVGDGSLKSGLQNMAKEYNIEDNVKFVGIRDDIPTMLHSMDVFVFPSIFEGLGLVLLEAQASGLPCIVSEAIQPEADLGINLVNKLNLSDGAKKWSEEILKTINKKQNNIEIIKNAFEDKNYSTQKCISKFMNIYKIN